MVNFDSLRAELSWGVCGTPANFSGFRFVKAKFHYAIWSCAQTGSKVVADRSEAGRIPAASWNLAYHLAR